MIGLGRAAENAAHAGSDGATTGVPAAPTPAVGFGTARAMASSTMLDQPNTLRAVSDAFPRSVVGPPDIDYAALVIDLDDGVSGMATSSVLNAGINGNAPRGRAGDRHPPRTMHDRPRV